MNKKILLIYHRVDYDGLCSMAVTKRALEQQGNVWIEIYGFNYGDKPLNIDELIASQDEIYLGYSGMPGIRVDGTAACELCWKYFYPDQEVPLGVLYLSHYDTWRHDVYSWDDEILPYQYGLRAEYSLNAIKFYEHFDYILREVPTIILEGQGILKYLKNVWKGCVKGYSFDVLVAGKYRGICMLTNTFGSSQFDSVKDQYDCYICVNRKESDLYNFSIYTNENCEFNAGEFMKAYYGGGGHKSAAGGKLNLSQFVSLVRDCRIDGN